MNKRALLVGINDYSSSGTLGDLRFARQDAEAVAAALKSFYGFNDSEITLMTCESKGELCPATPYSITGQLAPELFPKELELFIFGFWGHGIWENNNRYMCLKTSRRNALAGSSLLLSNVLDRINRLPIRNACLILDCCQNTTGERSVDQYMKPEEQAQIVQAAKNLARDIGLRRSQAASSHSADPAPCVAVLNACKQGQVANEWDDRKHGIFTAHLLDAMQNQYRTVNDWVAYLEDRVSQTSVQLGKSRQTPFYCLEGAIELPVAVRKAVPAALEGSTVPLVPAVSAVSAVSGSGSVITVEPAAVNWSEAALLLIAILQKSGPLYENGAVSETLSRYKARIESLLNQFIDNQLDGLAMYREIQTTAQQIGTWIQANRALFGGRPQVYVSYLWYAWVQFADANGLQEITRAMNPED